jgi:hypothetical protein
LLEEFEFSVVHILASGKLLEYREGCLGRPEDVQKQNREASNTDLKEGGHDSSSH